MPKNFESKAFFAHSYAKDLQDGYIPVYRSDLDRDEPRDLHVVVMPDFTEPNHRACAINKDTGTFTTHNAQGRFQTDGSDSVLDIVMRREVKPESKVYPGTAYLTPDGTLVAVRFAGVAEVLTETNVKPFKCTLTFDEAA